MLKQDVKMLAEALLKQHNLNCIVDFSSAHYNGKYNRKTNTISLSSYVVEHANVEQIKLIILHEIAHALVGIKHHHDKVWKQKCIEIGGDGRRCANFVEMPYKYKLVCEHCGNEYFYFRKPQQRTIKHALCHKCHSHVKLEEI